MCRCLNQVQNERGNISLLMLGILFVFTVCILILLLSVRILAARETAGTAADAAAWAAAIALEQAFIVDVSPQAYGKLNSLTDSIVNDPLYKNGNTEASIVKHTIPSELRNELLRGNRGQTIQLYVLLQYGPFFSEQALGMLIANSFQQHFDTLILPKIREYTADRIVTFNQVRFPVHRRIEVTASCSIEVGFLNKLLVDILSGMHVKGGGFALRIKVLDDHQIPYRLSDLPILKHTIEQ